MPKPRSYWKKLLYGLLHKARAPALMLNGRQRDDSEVEIGGQMLKTDVASPRGCTAAVSHVLVMDL